MGRLRRCGVIVAIPVGLTLNAAVGQTTPPVRIADTEKTAQLVPRSPASIAKGMAVFQTRCVPCHGPNADGKGEQAAMMDKKPADLTRRQYTHGSSDTEIFATIKNGVAPDLIMPPWDGVISDEDIGNLVNYLSTLRK